LSLDVHPVAAPIFPFHFALPVRDLEEARRFYGGLLGCAEGRSTVSWIDFDLYGHQLSLHCFPDYQPQLHGGGVDGQDVPLPHFGVVLDMPNWQSLAARLREAGTSFILAPQVRFEGQSGEQATMFLLDPSGNALEFKGFRDLGKVFAT